jgi:SAM-dependent methyltransferase
MSDVNIPTTWDSCYEGGNDGWDLGGPAPALAQLAASGRLTTGSMLVLGAGRGHDARLFARHGFQVTAVDFAASAAREMERLADPEAPVEIVQHDIFTLPSAWNHSFDYVLEHTCFCAIDLRRRAEFADLVVRMLKPRGMYVSLAFPLSNHTGGPPFAVSAAELLGLFQSRGCSLVTREVPAESVPQRLGREELFLFQRADANGAQEQL